MKLTVSHRVIRRVAAGALGANAALHLVLVRLPSFHPTDWELSGTIALLLEAIVVGAAVHRSRAERSRASSFA